jgi:RHS repeat-associated protein
VQRWVVHASCLIAVCAGAIFFGVAIAANPSAPTAPIPIEGAGSAEPGSHGAEIPTLRTANSRTYQGAGGSAVVVASGAPMNYRDANGDWRAIDDTLVPQNSGYTNKADRWNTTLPAQLSDAVSVSSGGLRLGFSLQDASGDASVHGDHAVYADALPSTTVTYQASSSGLKETLDLTDQTAPDAFTYTVRAAADVSLGLDDAGAITVSNASGDELFVPAPTATDARGRSGPASYTLIHEVDSWKLVLHVNRAWLSAADRAFPVTVDPTVSISKDRACWIDSVNQSQSNCAASTLNVKGDGVHDTQSALLHFALNLPDDADISYAGLTVTPAAVPSGDVTLGAYALTQNWNTSVTWNSTGFGPWSGTQYSPDAALDVAFPRKCTATDPNTGNCTTWTAPGQTADITDIAQGWLKGKYGSPPPTTSNPYPNFGIALRATRASGGVETRQLQISNAPTLTIAYQTVTGRRSQFAYDTFSLSDRSSATVNLATGDLEYSNRDFSMDIPGSTIEQTRLYDSRRLGSSLDLSPGWKFSLGRDTTCWPKCSDGKVDQTTVLDAPDGVVSAFNPNSTAPTFDNHTGVRAVDGEDATLENVPGSQALAKYNHTRTSWSFYTGSSPGTWSAVTTPGSGYHNANLSWSCPNGGYTINGDISLPGVNGSTWVYLTLNQACTTQKIWRMTDLLGRVWSYQYDSAGRLWKYTDPGGNLTSYEYNGTSATSLLNKITTPDRTLSITYAADASNPSDYGRVQSITQTVQGSTVATTTYSYDMTTQVSPCGVGERRTRATDPSGRLTTYCLDERGRPTRVFHSQGEANRGADSSYTAYGPLSLPTATQAGGSGDTGSRFNFGVSGIGNATSSSDPYGAATTTGFSSSNLPYLPSSNVDQQGQEVDYGYTSAGNLSSIQPLRNQSSNGVPEGLRLTWNSTYGQMTSVQMGVTTPHTTNYQYDSMRRLTKIDPPVAAANPLGSTLFTYDGANRMTSRTDGRGIKATYVLDKLDRVTQESTPDGSEIDTVYNAEGDVAESDVYGPGRVLSAKYLYTYDGQGNQLTATITDGNGSTQSQYSRTYTYNLDGALHTVTTAEGVTTYGYNSEGLPSTVTDPATGNSLPIKFVYDSDNIAATDTHHRLLEIDYPDLTPGAPAPYTSGVRTTYSYDHADRITDITTTNASGQLQHWSYKYLLNQTNYGGSGSYSDLRQLVVRPDGKCEVYRYDYLGRLTEADTYTSTDCPPNQLGANYTAQAISRLRYSYDGDSNLTSRTAETWTGSAWATSQNDAFGFDGADQLVGTGSSHDAAGNQTARAGTTRDGGLTASYSQVGQLASFTLNPLNGVGTALGLGYGGGDSGDLTSVGSSKLLGSELGTIASVPNSGTATFYTRDPDGNVLDSHDSGGANLHYYLSDDRGSTTLTTTGGGSPDQTQGGQPSPLLYDPYGNLQTSGTIPAFGFDGGYATGGQALYHFGKRFYDPAVARWTQMDSLDQAASVLGDNKYAYANDDPVNNADPTGECVFDRYLYPTVFVLPGYIGFEHCRRGHIAGYHWFHYRLIAVHRGRSVCFKIGVSAGGAEVVLGGASIASLAGAPEASPFFFYGSVVSGFVSLAADFASEGHLC